MPNVKNFRHGRIRIVSGDDTPLEFQVDMDVGDLAFERQKPSNVVDSRGETREVTRGSGQPVPWSFSTKFMNKELIRCLEAFIFPGQVQTFGSLTALANNPNLATTYPFEQGSILVTTTPGTYTKGTVGDVPNASGEYAEEAGAEDVEGVIRATEWAIFPPSSVTSVAISYDAVGKGTAGDDTCLGGVKTFHLVLDVYDPCDAPTFEDPDAGTVIERYTVRDAFLESWKFQEAEDFNTVAFSGRAIADRITIETVP